MMRLRGEDDPRSRKRHENVQGEPTQVGLLGLPVEILDRIILDSGLGAQEVGRVRQTCRALRRVVADPHDVVRWQCLSDMQTCARHGFTDAVRRLVANAPEPIAPRLLETSLMLAIEGGHTEVARTLVVDAQAVAYRDAMRLCIVHDRLDIFRLCLDSGRAHVNHDVVLKALTAASPDFVCALHACPRVQFNRNYDWAFAQACHVGCPNLVAAMLQLEGIDPAAHQSECLVRAATHKSENIAVAITRLLLEDGRANVRGRVRAMLLCANDKRNIELIDLLVSDERVTAVWDASQVVEDAAGAIQTCLIESLVNHPAMAPHHFDGTLEIAATKGLPDTMGILLACPHVRVHEHTAYNTLVRALDANSMQCVDKLLRDRRFDPSMEDNRLLMWACTLKGTRPIRRLLQDPRVDPAARNNGAFEIAIHHNHMTTLEVLLEDGRADPTAHDNLALRLAVRAEYQDCLMKILKDDRIDPSVHDNMAIRMAARNGWCTSTKLLLSKKRVDPSAMNNAALCDAAGRDRVSVFKHILGDARVDPTAQQYRAIRSAARFGRRGFLEKLLKDERVQYCRELYSALNEACSRARINRHYGVVKDIQRYIAKHRVASRESE